MSVNRTSLGKRISFYRSKSNLTQEVLAAKVNCSREYIVQIENGTKVPSLSVLVKKQRINLEPSPDCHFSRCQSMPADVKSWTTFFTNKIEKTPKK